MERNGSYSQAGFKLTVTLAYSTYSDHTEDFSKSQKSESCDRPPPRTVRIALAGLGLSRWQPEPVQWIIIRLTEQL